VRRPEPPRGPDNFAPLATERLRLEPIRADHANGMFAGLREPSLYAYQTDEPPRDVASLRERYARLAAGHSTDELAHWLNWILVRRDDGAAAGYVQATVDKNRASAVIGYLVLPVQQRRGFGGEAVAAMVRHLFAAGVGRLLATIDARNAASIALIERLGFTRLGTHRSDDVIGGVRGFDHEYELRAPRSGGAGVPKPTA
jgi:ribosomal-protein-alanine N-acetyltransferase